MTGRNLTASRRLKFEHNRLLRQTILAIASGVTLILVFLFVILPNASRIFGVFFDNGQDGPSYDTLPPPAPILYLPAQATSSADLKISIQGEVDSKITLNLNGSQSGETTIGQDGLGQIDVKLSEGDNYLTAQASDKAGNESVMSKTQNITLDTTPPTIEITSPKDGDTIVGKTKQTISIEGKTEPGAKVYLNDRFVFAREDGTFIHTYLLAEGANALTLRAEDKAKNTTETKINLTFTP